jgi:hypothetical protein
MIKYIFYVLLFAIATMIIYTWGLIKTRNQSKDLLNILYLKSERVVLNSLKKKGSLSKKEIENELIDIKASLFYSKNKLTIKDPKTFSKSVINTMINKNLILKDNLNGTNRYILK